MSAQLRQIAEINNDNSYRRHALQVEQNKDGTFRIRTIVTDEPTKIIDVAAENLREFAEHIIDLIDIAQMTEEDQ